MLISFDPSLPITAKVSTIAEVIAKNQVVILAGETGSGKTTQLPKICLQLGRKHIAHTQPRRIAARNVATRLAQELQVNLGETVGYQVRFTRKTSVDTQIKVMTDGILLAELAKDKLLRRYDTIIIDEAHERSLNIDFLLGYLKQLLVERPELKVIVTSATIDTARFSQHFNNAPIIEVSGRTYPVDIRYRPFDETKSDQSEAICDALLELSTQSNIGDVLIFLSGEREIRDAKEILEDLFPEWEIVGLYARLSAGEQQRVFASHNSRRVVLATNVAETSITVPGIRYVIDTGKARISRYSARSKVQRLPIEAISKASANQRSGRCGRLGPGICIRLYSEDDFESRPEFTEPEILRTNLASVILKMTQAGLGDITSFKFVEAPVNAQINDGIKLLEELGAISEKSSKNHLELTKIGRTLAQIPIEPRLGRMLIEASRRECLKEVLVIVSGLTIQDVRERPVDKQAAADELHRRFYAESITTSETLSDEKPLRYTVHTGHKPVEKVSDSGGDIIALLRLWRYLKKQRKTLSNNAFRRMCRNEYLNYLRIREWEDLHLQLRKICQELGMKKSSSTGQRSDILTSILSGLLSHIGLLINEPENKKNRGPRTYLGARGSKFSINPGSALAKVNPDLVMAVEIVQTTRSWARMVAQIDPKWVEQCGKHLLNRTVSEPHWSIRAGTVMAYEKVSLYGVPIVAKRRVNYSKIDTKVAREIFIRAALVEGDWRTKHKFFAINQQLRADLEDLEDRSRRHDLIVEDQQIFDFYAARIPDYVVSSATFDKWWRNADKNSLTMTKTDLVRDGFGAFSDFPDQITISGQRLAVKYIFQPGAKRDGVNIFIPLQLINQLNPNELSWPIPGLRLETATELIRSLPKHLRRNFIPITEYVTKALELLPHNSISAKSFCTALAEALKKLTGEEISNDDWQISKISNYLQPTFIVVDKEQEIGVDKNFISLKTKFADQLCRVLTQSSAETVTGAKSWVFGDIKPKLTIVSGNSQAIGYPCLVDELVSVGLVITDSTIKQEYFHTQGIARLLTLTNPDPIRWVVSRLTNTEKLALSDSPYSTVPTLLADAWLKAGIQLANEYCVVNEIRNKKDYEELALAVRQSCPDQTRKVVAIAAQVLDLRVKLRRLLNQFDEYNQVKQDVSEQLDNLIYDRFISFTPDPWYQQLPRYLTAMVKRLMSATTKPEKDAKVYQQIHEVENQYFALLDRQPEGPLPTKIDEIAFMIEELRVSLFAQQLGTYMSISVKRIKEAIADAQKHFK